MKQTQSSFTDTAETDCLQPDSCISVNKKLINYPSVTSYYYFYFNKKRSNGTKAECFVWVQHVLDHNGISDLFIGCEVFYTETIR